MATKNSNVTKLGALIVGVSACLTYGCERPNPYKLAGDTSAVYEDCPTPSTNDGSSTVGSTVVASSTSVTSGGSEVTTGVTTGPSSSVSTGSGNQPPPVELTELDERELDYAEALRTASILIVGDAPTVAEIYELADLPPDMQKEKYIEIIDRKLADPRFASSLVEFFKYTYKMGGAATTMGEPTRDTAPNFAAQIVYEGKDWRNTLTQQTNTCPSFNPATNTFSPASCTNMPSQTMVSGVLTDPGIHSLYYGNLAFRRNRFFHETFLCKSGNEQAGGEPTDAPPSDAPCSGENPIPGYNNKWAVSEIAGKCNGGRVNFHEYNNSNVCSNCHSTWNHRSPLFAQFDSRGIYQSISGAGEYSVFVPVTGSPRAKMSDWLCVASSCPNGGNNKPAWKKMMKVNGVDTPAPAANLVDLGKVMVQDDEVIECSVKRMWNYAMGRADITEIGGRSWVNLPDRADKNPELLTMSKLISQFKGNGYNLKQVFRTILLSDDFTRF